MTNYYFSASLSPTTGDDAIWYVKETLKTAGWVVVSSSNATTFAAGDILSSSTTLAASNAWFVIKQPLGATGSYGNVRRELAIQRGTTSRSWRIKYSYSASFTGSATATVLPNALDEVRTLATADFPTFSFRTTFFAADGGYKLHVAADQDPPYSFYFLTIPNGGGTPNNCLFMDGMLSGTFDPGDADPYVFYTSETSPLSALLSAGTLITCVSAANNASPLCWTRKGQVNQIYGGIGILQYVGYDSGQNSIAQTHAATNAYNSKDDLLPILWYRGANANPNGAAGYKGVSSLMKMPAGVVRSTGDTYSTTASGSKDFIRANGIAFVWNGTDPTL